MKTIYEVCRDNLSLLAEWYSGHVGSRNEATTRFAIIDRLFLECLSWSRDDIICEESKNNTYADYTFLAPRRMLIVEAKKEGIYFELPAGIDQLEFSLTTLLRDYPALKAAIEQASGYCQSRGVPYGAVCNGSQMVIFVATRNDGLPPLDGKALVFSSLESMLDNFKDFWNALSKPAIELKKIQYRLTGESLPELPPKLSSTIMHYPGNKNRNTFQADMQIISELIIEDITRNRDIEAQFLKECYCPSGALSQYALISKKILSARYDALFDSQTSHPAVVSATTKKGTSPDLLAKSFSRRPILLIGDVGVGKTAFIRNLIKVEAAKLFEKSISLYIDYGTQATLSLDLRKFIVQEMKEQLREEYDIDIEERVFVRGVYNLELERFRRGIYQDLARTNQEAFREKEILFLEKQIQDEENHLKHSLEHIAQFHEKQIVIFLDNSDQRDDKTQQDVFIISQELAEHWPATVFVTLRPETFHLSIQRGALSGYHPKAFTISPPRVDLVVRKRLSFALKLTSGEIPIESLDANPTIEFSALGTMIRVFLDSLEKNRELLEFLDNVSNGNIRLTFDSIREFFGSGHVDTPKIIKLYEESNPNQYIIPLHEFLRAVIYGDTEHFDSERSPIANLFDLSHLDSKEHFLLPLIIGLLISLSNAGTEGGFVETSKVYARLQGNGFTPEQIDLAIIRGHNKKLIETSARRIPQRGQSMPEALRATMDGAYHATRLCRKFTYIDAIIVDTPILDLSVKQKIVNTHEINVRIERARIFCSYLDEQWKQLSTLGSVFDWANVSTDLRKDIDLVQIRSKRK